jgi:hypothetical protein
MSAKPLEVSIAIADTVGVGHVNVGAHLCQAFEALTKQARPDGTVDYMDAVAISVPALTNLAFGLELLLKVHHFQHNGKYPRGHDIRVLGRQFSEAALNDLRRHYKELYDDPAVPKGLEFRWKIGPAGSLGVPSKTWGQTDFSSYDKAIDYIGPMFQRWRYIYEELQFGLEVEAAFSPVYIAAKAVSKAIDNHKGNRKITVRNANEQKPSGA